MQIIIVADSEWERIDWIECINQNIPEVVMVVRTRDAHAPTELYKAATRFFPETTTL